jgi:N-acetylneuraminate synthase
LCSISRRDTPVEASKLDAMSEQRASRFERRRRDGGCYVLAEAGSNHCRDREIALRLVAADAGADGVKFQVFSADRLYPPNAGVAEYLGDPTPIDEIIRSVELPTEWLPALAERAAERGLDFVASAFDEQATDLLDPYVALHKVASYEITHEPLLRHVASKGKPVILSTGGSTVDEARHALAILQAAGAPEVVVLQCTARYPAPLEAINAAAIPELRRALGVRVGLSDHSREPLAAPVAAAALGAALLEKHFTLDNELPGPDHRFALEPDELRAMVTAIREVEQVLGDPQKQVLEVEQELRAFARRSIFTVAPVEPGEPFSHENVAVLRNGTLGPGLEPARWDDVLAAAASRKLDAYAPLLPGDLAAR